MKKLNCLQAVKEAFRLEMSRDENVMLMGEDVRLSVFGTSAGLVDEFGPGRVRNTPLSENGFIGAAVGAAMAGIRPIVDASMSSFLYVAMDQLVSMAAKTTYTYGGQFKVPMVVYTTMGYRINNAAQHSDRPYPMFMNVPGFKIVAPSCASDTFGLMRAAIRDDDPVLFFADNTVAATKEEVPEDLIVPIGKADIKRPGNDVTIVGIAGGVQLVLEAAERLDAEGISAEVIDPRTLVPLDKPTILNSVQKTERLVIVDPAHKTCSAASEIAAIAAQEAFSALRSAVEIVATADVPIPFSQTLEPEVYPTVEKTIVAVKKCLGV